MFYLSYFKLCFYRQNDEPLLFRFMTIYILCHLRICEYAVKIVPKLHKIPGSATVISIHLRTLCKHLKLITYTLKIHSYDFYMYLTFYRFLKQLLEHLLEKII